MSFKIKFVLLVTFLLLLLSIIYTYSFVIINAVVVFDDTYYLLKKNTSQKKILAELKSKDINISPINWKLVSLIHNMQFIPKAGEYLIPKNSTIFEMQKILQIGQTITRNFTLIEGSTAEDLKKSLLQNKYLTGEITDLEEGIYKPDTYFFKLGYPRSKLLSQMKTAQENLLNNIWKKKTKRFYFKE